jgi:hypothetical protein
MLRIVDVVGKLQGNSSCILLARARYAKIRSSYRGETCCGLATFPASEVVTYGKTTFRGCWKPLDRYIHLKCQISHVYHAPNGSRFDMAIQLDPPEFILSTKNVLISTHCINLETGINLQLQQP